ncbi:alpha/beta hydrolase [Ciceribacter sp. L1K23]|uniref:alpha/beta hydrolase n=1 Tax=Ciceribacter sp. L1K23 TaxID=2820276 RepID=UPI001B83B359|nr:alpha/beta hydrolase [Ciceribacter sp. L1K23]MBR0556427.1 alpha/beta hydrolase [Ciceribacter sp. L1K23]
MSLDSYKHLYKAPEAGAPLVFTFHGTGGDEHQFPGLVQQILPGAGIVSPRGDVSEYGASRFFKRTGEGVYDMADLAARTQTMAAFIRAQRDRHPGVPVYALGYSNGANILASVMFEAPDLIDRAVLMHPLIPWTPADQAGFKDRPILVTAGERDPICPLPGTRALVAYLEKQGAAVETVLHPGGHEVPASEIEAIARFLKG